MVFSAELRHTLLSIVESQSDEELIRIFDSLKSKDRIQLAIKAVMGMGKRETGTPTEYVVGRKSFSKKYGVHTVHLKRADGSPMHRMARVTLMKRKDSEGNEFVSAAIGDMGARIISLKKL